MDINYFLKINNMHGASKRESELYNIKKQITKDFDRKLLTYDVKIQNIEQKVLLLDSPKKDEKRIISKPNETFLSGDIVEWEHTRWIITEVEPSKDMFTKGKIQRCVSSLKWLNSNGAVCEAPFTYRLDFYRGAGVESGKVIISPSERRYIYVQKNAETLAIKKDFRFIFDYRAWRCTAIDTLLAGIIYFELEEDEVKAADNVSLEIADYVGNVSDYRIKILNGERTSISVGAAYKLLVKVTNKDVIIDYPLIEYHSTNEKVATVDSCGNISFISQGAVSIVASANKVSDQIDINVLCTTVNNYTATIEGSAEIPITMMDTYKCSFFNNGNLIYDSCVFWLTAEDGVSDTNLAYIDSQDPISNTCSVIANSNRKYGNIILHVRNNNSLISDSKSIKIKSLI